MSDFCECCVLSGTGLCDGPLSRPEKPYRMCGCVIECDKVQQQPLHLKGGQSKQKDFLQADKLITEEINTFEIYGRTLGTTK